MGRKTRFPSTAAKDKGNALVVYNRFENGMVRDAPHAKLSNALADGRNVVIYPDFVEGRPGNVLWSKARAPAYKDISAFQCTATNGVVTVGANIFTADMVGCYIVVVGDPDAHYEIIAYIDPQNVAVGDPAASWGWLPAYIRGKVNLWAWHSWQRQFIKMWARELYRISLDFTTRTQVLVVSRDQPANAFAGYCERDRYTAWVCSSAGIFAVDVDKTLPLAYRINCNCPPSRVDDIDQGDLGTRQYGFIYAAARIAGDANIRTRLTPERIDMQTGPNAYDADTKQDWSDIWQPLPIGPGVDMHDILKCGPLSAGVNDLASTWAALTPTYGVFNVDLNGLGMYEVGCDFANVSSLIEVAERIQNGLADYVSGATCKFVNDATGKHFEIEAGLEKGTTVSLISAGTPSATSTDISDMMAGKPALGAAVVSAAIDQRVVIGPLRVPLAQSGATEWHLTHFPIYRTMEKSQRYQQDMRIQAFNDPESYIWEYDLRVCAAFLAARNSSIVTAMVGEFEQADEGSVLEWDNGDRDTILHWIDATHVEIDVSPYYDNSYMGACAIGNGRVIRASQVADVVTRTAGAIFVPGDVRDTIQWADGQRSYVREYLTASTVRVWDTNAHPDQGCTMDPVSRNYCSAVTDATLRSRKTTPQLLLVNRYCTPMPSGSIGAVPPGFLLLAKRGDSRVVYCQLPTGMEYLAGHYNAGYQFLDSITDPIQAILVFESKYAILCQTQTWGGATNTAEAIQQNSSAVIVSVLAGVDLIDKQIGCFDWGSIRAVGNKVVMFMTSEPGGRGVRRFDGFAYGENEAEMESSKMSRCVRDLELLQQASAALYHGKAGYILWAPNK